MNDRTAKDSYADLLYALEKRLLDPHIRRSSADVEALLSEDFLEIGSTGKVYDRAGIVAELRSETPFFWTIADFTARPIGPDLVMVNYRVAITMGPDQTRKRSLRTSIWRFRDRAWRMIFHQGTALSDTE